MNMTEESVFAEALEKQDAQERAAFLDRACAGKASLRQSVESLLSAYNAGEFLEAAAPGLNGTIDASPLAEKPGTIIGPYKLLQQIGEGGMGIVYMAEQTEPVRRRVALKIIKPGMDSTQVIGRFEAERQALAMMDHPNIAKVLDAGATESGRPYFVMELVKGVPITKFCDENQLTARERLELFIHVCQAVQHAHTKGIIHRDLKPSNVLVALYDDKPVPKVIDFGVAKATGEKLTERTMFTAFGLFVGTLEYMSPEQAKLNALDIDTRSDVYALGVLLYELLTGSTPLERSRLKQAALDELLRLIREEEPPRPSTRVTQSGEALAISTRRRTEPAKLWQVLRGELDWIVMKALEKDRTRRYETANGLARDVERYLKDESVEACPPSAGYRLRKFVRRNRAGLAVAGLVILFLTVLGLGAAWARADREFREAESLRELANQSQQKEKEANQQRDESRALNEKLLATQSQLQTTLYNSQLSLAKHTWDQGGFQLARDLLDQHKPKPGEMDLRGFEWHYLTRLVNWEPVILKGPKDLVNNVAISPDGKRVASASDDGKVFVWDARTGVVVHKFTFHGAQCVAFSPDGKRLAAGSLKDNRKGKSPPALKIWDADSGKELLNFSDYSGGVHCLAFSPDGNRLATGSADKTARIWDAMSGRHLLTLNLAADAIAVGFNENGKRLAAASTQLSSTREGTYGPFEVKVWDTEMGQEVSTFKVETGKGGVRRIVFSTDAKSLACCFWRENEARVWDVQSGQERFALKGHTDGVFGLAFSPDGKSLASGSNDETVRLWEMEKGTELVTFKGREDCWALAFSADGKRLATGTFKTVKVWDVDDCRESLTIKPKVGSIGAAALSADGKRAAYIFGSLKGPKVVKEGVKVVDLQTGQVIFSVDGRVDAVAFSPDGKQIATGFAPSKQLEFGLKIWDVQTGKEMNRFRVRASRLAFSPDGMRLATAGTGWTPAPPPKFYEAPKILDLHTGQELISLQMLSSMVASLRFSPDGSRLATGYMDGTVKISDSRTGAQLITLGKPTELFSSPQPVFSPDGNRIASISRDHFSSASLRVWDIKTGSQLMSLKGHLGHITAIGISPDGKRLASASSNHTLKLWDMQTGQETLTLRGHTDFRAVTFSPDGHRLMGCEEDGTLIIWDATPLPPKR